MLVELAGSRTAPTREVERARGAAGVNVSRTAAGCNYQWDIAQLSSNPIFNSLTPAVALRS